MSQFVIEGGIKLKGKVKLSGNKNSILPCMAACLLTNQEVVLKNVPQISDVAIFSEILSFLGSEVLQGEHQLNIKCAKVKDHRLPEELMVKLRASILFVGSMLAKVNKVEFSHPGGDVIGKRSIETHLLGFKKLGFEFHAHDLTYRGWRRKKIEASVGVFLDEASVTATENLILGSVLSSGEVTIKNCASEPHVVDLCLLLKQMGASIKGVGTSTLRITGVKELQGTEFNISSDYIEFGTYAIAAVITGGEVEIEKAFLPDVQPITSQLQKMGIIFEDKSEVVRVYSRKLVSLSKLVINIWPGFPTDLMSAAIVLATQAKGVSLMHDWMYESRMFFVDKLISMGANITIADPHRVIVWGPTKLHGRVLETPDIRAGMALVLAGLAGSGRSVINRAELIERGYEDVVGKLSELGANIQKIS